jgi:phosphoesterase RecJ-like protein
LELRLRNLISQANQGTISERPYIIEIDHHEPQESYADLEIRDPAKASTTELIYHFLKANHLPITKELADCILIGLMTDTGNFLHSNSSREALEIASEMLLYGASLPRIIDRTVRNQNFPVLKVWGRILENMKFDEKTGFVSSAVTAAEADRLLSAEEKLEAGDIFGGAASFLSSLAGVRVSLLLREEDGRVKGSLRTNSDDVDVAAIARKFGGGGHKKAAGFSLPGRLQETPTGWKIV